MMGCFSCFKGSSGTQSSPGPASQDKPKSSASAGSKFTGNPSVVDIKNFNPEQDAENLYAAMKGAGTDEDAVIAIICARSYSQLCQLELVYQQLYGCRLRDELKDELGGKLEKLILALFLSNTEHDVHTIREAIAGAGTDESAIIEVICTRSNKELEDIKALYHKKYEKELVEDLMGDTSGDFKRIVVSLCSASRDEWGPNISKADATAQAKRLYEKGEGQRGTNEVEFNKLFCRRGFHQLYEVFTAYQQFHEDGIEDTIGNEFSGVTKDAYRAIAVTALHGREAVFAQKLYSSMKGLGTNDDQLLRIMVSRSRVDLRNVAKKFQEKYETALESFIEDDVSGDFKTALLTLLRGNH